MNIRRTFFILLISAIILLVPFFAVACQGNTIHSLPLFSASADVSNCHSTPLMSLTNKHLEIALNFYFFIVEDSMGFTVLLAVFGMSFLLALPSLQLKLPFHEFILYLKKVPKKTSLLFFWLRVFINRGLLNRRLQPVTV